MSENQVAIFVENKINDRIRDHNEYVKRCYYLHSELTDEEYNEMLDKLDESIRNPPEEYKVDQLVRNEYINLCLKERKLILSDMKKSKDFKICLDDERRKLSKISINNVQLVQNLKDYTEEQIAYYYKDLMDSYFDMFVDKVKRLCPDDKDYSKTISSVYTSKNSKKTMKILITFFNSMKMYLHGTIMKLQDINTNDYMKIEEFMKKEIMRLIDVMHAFIYNFIEKQLKYINDSEMSDSKIVKIYSESVMAQMNESLMTTLPIELQQEFKDRSETCTKRFEFYYNENIKPLTYEEMKTENEDIEEVIINRNIKELKSDLIPSTTGFLDTFGIGDEIMIEELLNLYNQYYGKNTTKIGLGKTTIIKENFTKKNTKRNGKWVTIYTRI